MRNQIYVPTYLCFEEYDRLQRIRKELELYFFQKELFIEISYESTSFIELLYETKYAPKIGIYIIEVKHENSKMMNRILQLRKSKPLCYILLVMEKKARDSQISTENIEIIDVSGEKLIMDAIKLSMKKIEYGAQYIENPDNPHVLEICYCNNIYLLHSHYIYYVETKKSQHKIQIHLQNRSVESFMTLSKMTELLNNEKFIRCHKSIIVNMEYIFRFDKTTRMIYLQNGRNVECSVRHVKELEERIYKYYGIL